MKPSKRHVPGPERGQSEKRAGGGGAERRPEEIGPDAAQLERLEKEPEIQEPEGESGSGSEGGADWDAG